MSVGCAGGAGFAVCAASTERAARAMAVAAAGAVFRKSRRVGMPRSVRLHFAVMRSLRSLMAVAIALLAGVIGQGFAQAPRGRAIPILPGWYADPEAHVFDGQYWIFPTYSAPYDQQTFLDAFSSRDLVTWKKHPHVLDVADVTWAKRAVWAPSIVEKDGWYYLFFGANDIQNDQQLGGIGVARSRSPDGPFKDYLGKPLIDEFHNGAQPIDQMVFKDSRRHVLHRLRRLAALQHREAERRLHRLRAVRRRQHVQGDHAGRLRRRRVHAAQGRQVLLHVVRGRMDGTELRRRLRDRHVAVRAVRARRQDPAAGFDGRDRRRASLGAAVAGADKWYIVYHRRPLGETDRNHRVVSIDELRFDASGHDPAGQDHEGWRRSGSDWQITTVPAPAGGRVPSSSTRRRAGTLPIVVPLQRAQEVQQVLLLLLIQHQETLDDDVGFGRAGAVRALCA